LTLLEEGGDLIGDAEDVGVEFGRGEEVAF